MPAPATHYLAGIAFMAIGTVAGASLVVNMLIWFRDSTIINEPRPKTQYISQKTEDSLSPKTLNKLINSTTYSIREIASRIVCDRALHDESTIDALLWYITRPDHEQREKGLRALFMLTTKSVQPELNKPRVCKALVRSLEFCVGDVKHDRYDKAWNNWDFRDINERLCLMIIHRMISTAGASYFIKFGFVPKWLVKEPWGDTEQEIQENFKHCYNNSVIIFREILTRVTSHRLGAKQLRQAKLIADIRFHDQNSAANFFNSPVPNTHRQFALLPTDALLHPERSPEEQRVRRNHRDAMVLHDSSEPLGANSIITRDLAESSAEMNFRDELDELAREADRALRTQGLLAALTPRRLENMREILQSESDRMEQQGLEEEPSVGILRDILENEINNRLGGNVGGHGEGNDAGDEIEAENGDFTLHLDALGDEANNRLGGSAEGEGHDTGDEAEADDNLGIA